MRIGSIIVLRNILFASVCMSVPAIDVIAANPPIENQNISARICTVDFKKAIENSKLGKQEQSSFEALKKQMEESLGEKEKVLNDIADKMEDPDHLDSLSAEAETELKRKFRSLNQEYSQIQSQYLQALQQTNFKIVQRLTALVEKASQTAAKQHNMDIVLNTESCFYAAPQYDLTEQVVAIMDSLHEQEQAKAKQELPAAS